MDFSRNFSDFEGFWCLLRDFDCFSGDPGDFLGFWGFWGFWCFYKLLTLNFLGLVVIFWL